MSSKETGYLARSLGGFGPAHPHSEGPEEGGRGMFTQNALVRFAHFDGEVKTAGRGSLTSDSLAFPEA